MAWPKGKPAHNRGIPISDEQKRKQSEAMKGKTHKCPEEVKRKLSKAYKGKGNPMYGNPNGMLGKKHSEESKKKMSEAAKKRKPYFISKGEKEMKEFIRSIYNGIVLENDRSLLNGLELDVYLPELNLAFEYNGDFWHSSPERRDRDTKKIIKCHSLGVELCFIWESDWKHNNLETKDFISEVIG